MSFYSEVIDNIASEAEKTGPFAKIVYGSDPPFNGICMIETGVGPLDTHLNKGMIYDMPVVLNGKNEDQQKLLDDLTQIHVSLTRRTSYTDISTEACQVVDISTTALPSIIGREQNKQWVCGSSFNVKFYWRK
jgi:hypothetical protein